MKISIIVLSYNTKEITTRCLREVDQSFENSGIEAELIVLDNASSDGSQVELPGFQTKNVKYLFIQNDKNVGFSKGNNIALSKASGEYVLYLNSDVMVESSNSKIDWASIIQQFEQNAKIGALTVRVNLPSGQIDPASHRGFPTPLRSLWYFLGVEKLVKIYGARNLNTLRIFGGYHLLEEDISTSHEIDSGTAAFLLCRADILQKIGGFDEQFFMYGEDLDLCFNIKKLGYQVIWYPEYTVMHLKYRSGLGSFDNPTKRRIRWHFYDAMEKFYMKHYAKIYPKIVSWFVYIAIAGMKKLMK